MSRERYEFERLMVEQAFTAAMWRLGKDEAELEGHDSEGRQKRDVESAIVLLGDMDHLIEGDVERVVQLRATIEDALCELMAIMEPPKE